MRLQIYFLFYQFLVLYDQCKFTNAKALIGQNVRSAQENELRFVVAIIKYYPGGSEPNSIKCTGTLISRSDVLTSEHCLCSDQLSGLQIIIGSSILDRGTVYYPEWWISYDQWAVHKNIYREYDVNDIAFLNVLDRIPEAIQFAQLLPIPASDLTGYHARTAGWGLLNNNSYPQILQTSGLIVLDRRDCELKASNLMGINITVDEKTICTAANPYVLLREGDSGGPLFLRNNYIIGVNFGTVPSSLHGYHPEKLNLHVFVNYYYNFIFDLKD